MTMVIVTHEMSFARDVADRVVMLDDGVIIEEGPAKEFFTNPKHDRTKAFLRSITERNQAKKEELFTIEQAEYGKDE